MVTLSHSWAFPCRLRVRHFGKKMSVKEIRTPASGENQEGETFCCFHVCQEITIVIRIALGCIMIRYTRKKWIEKGDQKPIAECIALL